MIFIKIFILNVIVILTTVFDNQCKDVLDGFQKYNNSDCEFVNKIFGCGVGIGSNTSEKQIQYNVYKFADKKNIDIVVAYLHVDPFELIASKNEKVMKFTRRIGNLYLWESDNYAMLISEHNHELDDYKTKVIIMTINAYNKWRDE